MTMMKLAVLIAVLSTNAIREHAAETHHALAMQTQADHEATSDAQRPLAATQIMLELQVFQFKGDANAKGALPEFLEKLPRIDAASAPGEPPQSVQAAIAGGEVDKLLADAAAYCISAPRMFVHAGQTASVQIGREIAWEAMQPTAEPGVFRLVQGEPKFEGMRFDVMAEVLDDRAIAVRTLKMRFDQCVGREAVEGTSLEVGAPIIRSRESTHALVLKSGQRALLTTSALDESGELMLVVLKAKVVDPPSDESKPYTKEAGGR
jgi:hypothetical protein